MTRLFQDSRLSHLPHQSLSTALALIGVLTLSACSTPSAAPCLPNSADMEKAQPLDPISGEKLSPIDQKKLVADDDQKYNDLAVRHNNLISHVVKFCQ